MTNQQLLDRWLKGAKKIIQENQKRKELLQKDNNEQKRLINDILNVKLIKELATVMFGDDVSAIIILYFYPIRS